MTVVVCCFCGNQTGKPYPIEPFGRACPSCTDAFFSSRYRKPLPSKITEDDLAKIVAAQLGPPYAVKRPLKIDVSDTGSERKIETVGYGMPDRCGGLGLYVYRGPFRKRVYLNAQSDGDGIRPRLNWHRAEYVQIARKVAWIVWQETDGGRGRKAVVKGYWVISRQRSRELSRPYPTQKGERIGPPLHACAHYDPDFRLKEAAADVKTLHDLSLLPWGA